MRRRGEGGGSGERERRASGEGGRLGLEEGREGLGGKEQSCLAEANLAEGIDKTITKSVNISLVDNLKMV